MKRSKMIIIAGVAIVCIIAAAATASAANNETSGLSDTLIFSEDGAMEDAVVTECVYEVNLETGEVMRDGVPVAAIDPAAGESAHVYAEYDGETIVFSEGSPENLEEGTVRFFRVEEGEGVEVTAVEGAAAADTAVTE